MNWSDLSMSQRSELMQIYLKNGITSLKDMKKHYNSFAEGGSPDIPPERFFGIATPEVTDNNIYYSRNSLLPEVNITAKGDPRKVNNDYYKAHATERAALQDRVATREDYKALNPTNILEYTPVIGDALDAANVINDAANRNYLAAGIGAGMFLLPNIIKKPLKRGIKGVKRFFSDTPKRNYRYGHNAKSYAESLATKLYPPITITDINEEAIEKGYNKYKKAVEETELETSNKLLDFWSPKSKRQLNDEDYNKLENLSTLSPEYIDFVYSRPDLNPLSQEAVDAFLERQSRSIRGIYVEPYKLPENMNAEDMATQALTIPPKNGSDRLNTHGLYTSNGRYIADKFMRGEGNAGNTGVKSYMGIVKYPFNIDKTKPIKNQLREYRNQINNYDYDIENPIAKMTEAMYVRSTGDKTRRIYERSIHPNNNDPVVNLLELKDMGTDLPNFHGRWGLGDVSANADIDLFIPKKASTDFREFIDFYRRLKNANTFTYKKKNPEYDKAHFAAEELWSSQERKRNRLIDKLEDRKRKAINAGIVGGVLGVPIGMGFLVREMNDNMIQSLKEEHPELNEERVK